MALSVGTTAVVRSWNIGKINKNQRDTQSNSIWLKGIITLDLEGLRYNFFISFDTVFHRQITEVLMGKKYTIMNFLALPSLKN